MPAYTRHQVTLLLASLVVASVCCQGAASPVPAPTAPSATSDAPSHAPSAAPSASTRGNAPTAPSASVSAAQPQPPPGEDAPDDAGGPCAYAEQAGTCSANADKTFTFTGTVDGKLVTLKNNRLDPPFVPPAVGKPFPCAIKFWTAGTCTPCRFSIGSCGEAALTLFQAHWEATRR